jgi:hypothetical protein
LSKKSQSSKNSVSSKGADARNQSRMKGRAKFGAKKVPLKVSDYTSESSDESDSNDENRSVMSKTICHEQDITV